MKTDNALFELAGWPDVSTSSSLLDDCRKVVEQAGLSITDVDRIAVGLGPGSFTGIRLGCTAAKGLAWSLDIEVGGVCTFQALAAWVADREALNEGAVCVVADARMQEIFLGRYAVGDDGAVREVMGHQSRGNPIEHVYRDPTARVRYMGNRVRRVCEHVRAWLYGGDA